MNSKRSSSTSKLSLTTLCQTIIEHIDMPSMVVTKQGEVMAANKALLSYVCDGSRYAHHVLNRSDIEPMLTLDQWGKMFASEHGIEGGYLETELLDFRRAERHELVLADQSLYLVKLVVANPIGLTAFEQYQQMFMSHCSAMLIVDHKSLMIMDANDAAARLYQTTRETLLKLSLGALEVSSQDSSKSYEGQSMHMHAVAGERRAVEVYGSTLVLQGAKTLFLCIHDVTERESAYQMLRMQERLLSTGESVFKIGCWELDLVGEERRWSQQMYELFGVDRIMNDEEWLSRVVEADRMRMELFMEHFTDHDEASQIEGKVFTTEYQWMRPDDKLIDIELRIEAEVNEARTRIVALRGSAQDITEVRKRDREVGLYSARLERVNQSLEEFTSMASHDLREPARKVVAFGERILRQQKEALDERSLMYLDRIIQAGQRMDCMINSLMELSSCSPEVARRVDDVRIENLLEDVVSLLEVRIEEAHATVDISEASGLIRGDYNQLMHLFQNLLGNAIKFNTPGEAPSIKISSNCHGPDMIRVTVRDHGIGIAPEYITEIFKPFRRLHGKCSDYKGNGIGLSICNKIVAAHGGAISVESTSGEGASFNVDLPAHHAGLRKR